MSISQASRSKDPRHATKLLERAAVLLVSASGVSVESASSWRRLRAQSYATIFDGQTDEPRAPQVGSRAPLVNLNFLFLTPLPYVQSIVRPGTATMPNGDDSRAKTPPANEKSAAVPSTASKQQQVVLSGRPASRGGGAAVAARATSSADSSRGSVTQSVAGGISRDLSLVRQSGEAGGARLLLLHKLWSSLADIAARVGATDVVLQV